MSKYILPSKEAAEASRYHLTAFLGRFFRPDFDRPIFPYALPHVSHPKEILFVYLAQLSPQLSFALPPSVNMVAIPLFEANKNFAKFGDMVAALPYWLSRVSWVCEK